MAASVAPKKMGRRTRESGYPVRRGLSINRKCSGILDHPLARMMTAVLFNSPPRLKEIPQQRRRLALTDRRLDLGDMMASRRREEPHAGLDGAALGIGRAVIQPPYSR